MEKIPVKCPHCGRRLFDAVRGCKGAVHAKCTRCKTLSVLDLENVCKSSDTGDKSKA